MEVSAWDYTEWLDFLVFTLPIAILQAAKNSQMFL